MFVLCFHSTYAIHLTEKAFEYILNLDVAYVDIVVVAFIQICKNFTNNIATYT